MFTIELDSKQNESVSIENIETEVDMLGKQNEQILSEQRHKDVLVDELEASEIYKRFHTPGVRHDSSDYLQLKDALNTAYNYFKGNSYISKFPSKHKIEKAIKNINYEMEKASQEFSKLFNYDDKTK